MAKDLDAATVAAIRAKAPNVHNGTFTVSHPEKGHFTIKVWTAQKGDLAGKRIVGLLTGPDNERDFTGCAFWNDEKQLAYVYKRLRGQDSPGQPISGYEWREDWSVYEQKVAIWCDLAVRGATEERHGYWWQHGYRLERASRCAICNRTLTHPESIDAGVGPECAKKS